LSLFDRLLAGQLARRLQEADGSPEEISSAANRLAEMGASAIKPLLETLKGHPAKDRVLETLGRVLNDATLPRFIEALQHGDVTVADAATTVLGRSTAYDPVPILDLFGDASISKARVEKILQDQGERIPVRTVLTMMTTFGKESRGSALRLIEKRVDAEVLNEIMGLAGHAEWWFRLHAARLLSRLPGETTVATLLRLLSDDHTGVRLESVRSLQVLEATMAIPALCASLEHPDLKVQSAAIEALVSIADVSAVPHLLQHLKNGPGQVRRGAVEVLNQVVTVDAIKDLVGALRDADWWVRVRAADALGTLGGERVVEAVIGLIDDPDEFIRRYAVEILNTVPDSRAVMPLIRALEDPDWWVRERAIDALARTKDRRAVAPLIDLLEQDLRAAPHCVRALGAIGDAEAVDSLCRLATSEDAEIKREAISALTTMLRGKLPDDARARAQSALGDAVQTGRGGLWRNAPRSGHGPEAGRGGEAVAGAPAPRAPSNPSFDTRKLATGTILGGRFRVMQRIGGGGFGTVYLVEDTVVREEMALKLLSPQFSLDDAMIKRFVQELKLTRRVSHPNVIRIHDLLELDGVQAISMEYFQGRDLGRLLREEGTLSLERALKIGGQALEGLTAAHDSGIVHRDIKPANLLVGEDDLTKIVDFGLAAVAQSSRSRITRSGLLVGTPEYISPEQITGQQLDARSDLYALGVVLYEAISGKQPFAGETAVNTLFQHLEGEIPTLASLVPDVPPALDSLVMRAMSRSPDDRPQSARDMLQQLREAA